MTNYIGFYEAKKDPDGGFAVYEYRINCGWTKHGRYNTLAESDQAAAAMAAKLPGLMAYHAAQAAQAAQEAAQPVKKEYRNRKTNAWTNNASLAMKWHRAGDMVLVQYDDKTITIQGQQQPRNTREDKNRAHCRHIAETVEAYADGSMFRCPDCGEDLRLPDDVGDKYRCPGCGEVNEVDYLEHLGLWDYMADMLDIDWILNSNREYKACRVLVAYGGPNIYIDTARALVQLYWWTEYAEYPLSYDARDAIDEWAEEYWNI